MSDIYAELMAKIVFPSADAAAAFARLKPPTAGGGDMTQLPTGVAIFTDSADFTPVEPTAPAAPLFEASVPVVADVAPQLSASEPAAPTFNITSPEPVPADETAHTSSLAADDETFTFVAPNVDPFTSAAELTADQPSEKVPPLAPAEQAELTAPQGQSFDMPAPHDPLLDFPAPDIASVDVPAPVNAFSDVPAPADHPTDLPTFDLSSFDLPAPEAARPNIQAAPMPDQDVDVIVKSDDITPLDLGKNPAPVLNDTAAAPAPVAMYIVAAPPKVASGPFVPEEFKKIAPRPQTARTKKALSELVGDYDPANWLEPVLRDLVAAGASDVHLTMNGITKKLTVEARTDGDLELVRVIEGRDASVIVNKLKTNADLSTSSSKVPGDGRYELPIDGFPYRIRAVSLPLFDGGEKLVLRLPSTGPLKELEKIGFTEKNLGAVRTLLARPGGMTLIAGPMGEGKTTTAHATIMDIGTNGKAVMAVEDPVERVLAGVAQIEVNEEIGSGFGSIMRYLVRADFDTLFIGEIRDAATAAAAVRMAKAGRRVISTIHATDNVTAMLRLIELSDDSALSVLDAVSGVISQRLVRKIDPESGGYDGRHPIHEVLFINNEFTDKLIENKSLGEIRLAAEATSTTFADNLRELVEAGITDNYESRRVIGHDV